MNARDPIERPLDGVKVLDLSLGLSGGYCTKMLRNLGGDVIKVEPRDTGDETRSVGPFLNNETHIETSAPFLYLNQGKKSVTLNLSHPDARNIIEQLAAESDVVVESFKPGYLSGLGLDYERLEKVNPTLIMASSRISGRRGLTASTRGRRL